jgi:putative intracellular protease/amidase
MKLSGKKVAILATHGFEQSELEVPRDKLKAAGATVHIISPENGEIKPKAVTSSAAPPHSCARLLRRRCRGRAP